MLAAEDMHGAARATVRASRSAAGLAILVALCASADGAAAETLTDALVAAYNNNPTLQAARAALRATDEAVPQALANYRPSILGTGSLGKSRVERQNFFGTTAGTTASTQQGAESRTPRGASVVISQPLYRGGRTEAQAEQAENLVRASRARLLTTEQDVLLQAATAYADVHRDQAVLELNIKNEQVLRRQLEATRDQFEVGEVTRTDVAQAEARLARATAGRIEAEGNLNSSRATFQKVTGISPGALAEPAPLTDLPGTLDEAVVAAGSNPTVVAATYDEMAARNGVRVATGELLPTLSLNGQYDREYDSFSERSFIESEAVTAELSVPFFPDGGAAYSRIRQAKQTVQQRRNEIDEAKRAAAEAATQAWEALVAARAQIESFEQQIRANEIALEGVRQEASVGARTVLDILDAEQELLDSQVNRVRAQRDLVVAGLRLRAAVGRLTAASLDLPVEQYDVETYYREVRDKIWGVGEDIR